MQTIANPAKRRLPAISISKKLGIKYMPTLTRFEKKSEKNISIYYEVTGIGDEVIVFHHGNGNCLRDWYTLGYVDILAKDFTLVLIDSRGYGRSSKPYDANDYNLESRADDTIAVMNQLGIESAHCFGGSIGAAICMLLAKFHPQRFKSYIFATPFFELFDDNIKTSLSQGIEAFIDKLLGDKINNKEILSTFLANDAKALLAANSSEWFNYQDYIHFVDKPSLVYVGAKEPSLEKITALAEQLNQPTNNQTILHVFPNVDHAEVYWQGSMVAPVIKAFIDGIVKVRYS